MAEPARIHDLIAPSLEAMGFVIVRLRFTGGKRMPTLQVMVERAASRDQARLDDGGITADDCADISRTISALLDVEDPIVGSYHLEVSSPGIDRPLVRLADFGRFRGFDARIETRQAIDGRRRFVGRLDGIDADRVRLIDDSAGAVALPFPAIQSAKLKLTDQLLNQILKSRPRPPTKESNQ
jgi:ribosome maturation factor RimP